MSVFPTKKKKKKAHLTEKVHPTKKNAQNVPDAMLNALHVLFHLTLQNNLMR